MEDLLRWLAEVFQRRELTEAEKRTIEKARIDARISVLKREVEALRDLNRLRHGGV